MTIETLEGDPRVPVYQRLADQIRSNIVNGVHRPGDQLQSENVIAKNFQLAPGTARQAISILVQEGLLERIQGKGTFVRRAAFDQSLFRFFRLSNRAGQREVPESEILHRRIKKLPEHVAQKLEVEKGSKGISVFRLRRVDGEPIMFENIWLPLEPFQAFMDLPDDEIGPLLYPIYDRVCGQVVARAEESLSADIAAKDIAAKLATSIGAPVITIERIAFSFDDKPLEWRHSSGRADLFQYQIDIR